MFVKKVPSAGAVPSIDDYDAYADTEGFRTRVNYHYRLLDDAKPGKYYIAVFNNNVYLQEKAMYDVEVTVALPEVPGVLPADPPLCPADCYAPERGECAADTTPSGSMSTSRVGKCVCKPGYGGDMCEGLTPTVERGTAAGILIPGGWAYVKFDVDATAAGKNLTIKFWHEGGHPVVLMKKDGWPSLLDNHYVLSTTEELGTEVTFSISPKGAGSYVLGVFNMQYYRDSTCSWAVDLVEYIPPAPPPTPPPPTPPPPTPPPPTPPQPLDDTDDSPAGHRGLFWLLAMSAIAIAG